MAYYPKTLLVAGFATRHVAASAHRAGYTVYAVDHFCDSDLFSYVLDADVFLECADLERIVTLACKKWSIDAILVTSGAETLMIDSVPVLGSHTECAAKFCDKQQIQDFFEMHGIPTPKQIDPISPVSFRSGREYMLKPQEGAGGWRNKVVTNQSEIEKWIEEFQAPYLLQEYMPGIPASVCCVTTGMEARAIAVNIQIMRDDPGVPFGFSGSCTPFIDHRTEQMIQLAEKAALASGCIGIIGIDFIVGDEIWAIEVNPRFQATLETVERATGVNLVQTHIDACNGLISASIPKTPQYHQTSIRRILFAEKDLVWPSSFAGVNPFDDLMRFSDIPHPGTVFEPGHAMISVYGTGADLAAAKRDLHTSITSVLQYIQ
ncbi:MAG: ATP-grasp domain-containing protein [Methanomicrobiales archaeon]|jgi:predicted ATP-grasp superfamily ATP-dependent carboligase|nr:ATP-grasp domain-containing protein [Methanomicrobiales archaeon]